MNNLFISALLAVTAAAAPLAKVGSPAPPTVALTTATSTGISAVSSATDNVAAVKPNDRLLPILPLRDGLRRMTSKFGHPPLPTTPPLDHADAETLALLLNITKCSDVDEAQEQNTTVALTANNTTVECDLDCKYSLYRDFGTDAAQNGIALVFNAFNATEWCGSDGNKNWCPGNVTVIVDYVAQNVGKILPEHARADDCGYDCISDAVMNVTQRATASAMLSAKDLILSNNFTYNVTVGNLTSIVDAVDAGFSEALNQDSTLSDDSSPLPEQNDNLDDTHSLTDEDIAEASSGLVGRSPQRLKPYPLGQTDIDRKTGKHKRPWKDPYKGPIERTFNKLRARGRKFMNNVSDRIHGRTTAEGDAVREFKASEKLERQLEAKQLIKSKRKVRKWQKGQMKYEEEMMRASEPRKIIVAPEITLEEYHTHVESTKTMQDRLLREAWEADPARFEKASKKVQMKQRMKAERLDAQAQQIERKRLLDAAKQGAAEDAAKKAAEEKAAEQKAAEQKAADEEAARQAKLTPAEKAAEKAAEEAAEKDAAARQASTDAWHDAEAAKQAQVDAEQAKNAAKLKVGEVKAKGKAAVKAAQNSDSEAKSSLKYAKKHHWNEDVPSLEDAEKTAKANIATTQQAADAANNAANDEFNAASTAASEAEKAAGSANKALEDANSVEKQVDGAEAKAEKAEAQAEAEAAKAEAEAEAGIARGGAGAVRAGEEAAGEVGAEVGEAAAEGVARTAALAAEGTAGGLGMLGMLAFLIP